MTLSVRAHMVLAHAELAGDKWHRGGLIRTNLGVSEWVYARELDRLIDSEDAQREQPALCRRLRALREKRRGARRGAVSNPNALSRT